MFTNCRTCGATCYEGLDICPKCERAKRLESEEKTARAGYKLSHLLDEATKYITGTISVRIVRRDEEGMVTHSALVPIHRVKTDFDDRGVEIMIDESHIKWEVHR
jgi:hypothetical protein